MSRDGTYIIIILINIVFFESSSSGYRSRSLRCVYFSSSHRTTSSFLGWDASSCTSFCLRCKHAHWLLVFINREHCILCKIILAWPRNCHFIIYFCLRCLSSPSWACLLCSYCVLYCVLARAYFVSANSSINLFSVLLFDQFSVVVLFIAKHIFMRRNTRRVCLSIPIDALPFWFHPCWLLFDPLLLCRI